MRIRIRRRIRSQKALRDWLILPDGRLPLVSKPSMIWAATACTSARPTAPPAIELATPPPTGSDRRRAQLHLADSCALPFPVILRATGSIFRFVLRECAVRVVEKSCRAALIRQISLLAELRTNSLTLTRVQLALFFSCSVLALFVFSPTLLLLLLALFCFHLLSEIFVLISFFRPCSLILDSYLRVSFYTWCHRSYLPHLTTLTFFRFSFQKLRRNLASFFESVFHWNFIWKIFQTNRNQRRENPWKISALEYCRRMASTCLLKF